MNSTRDVLYKYVLTQTPGLSLAKQQRLLAALGSAEAVFAASTTELQELELTPKQITALQSQKSFESHAAILEKIKTSGIQIISCQDKSYPKRLLETAAYPVLLYAKGDVELLSHSLVLAVVGARDMTSYGESVLKKLIPELASAGFVIVSGVAFGVDALAHRLCLTHGGKTIGVQAQGVDQGYPRAHQKLFEEMTGDNLVISESAFSPKYVGPEIFPQRNRLLSGISDGVLVIEAREKSGSLITAYFGLEQNRHVYAVPGNIDQEMSRGCLQLIKQGAKIVMSAQDVIEDFATFDFAPRKVVMKNSEVKDRAHKVSFDVFESPLEKKIFELCLSTPHTIDEIIENTLESPSQIMATTTKMQLVGKLSDVGGKRFASVA